MAVETFVHFSRSIFVPTESLFSAICSASLQ